jgi:DNA-directed RNA polymerase subunit RPC12/RpoP
METILTCTHCGTKLKVKTAMLKLMKEIRCAKCRHVIPTTEGGGAAAEAQAESAPKAAHKGGATALIHFACVKCARKITLLHTLAGKKIKCPGCAEVNVVPGASQDVAAAPAADPAPAAAPAPAAPVSAPVPAPVAAAPVAPAPAAEVPVPRPPIRIDPKPAPAAPPMPAASVAPAPRVAESGRSAELDAQVRVLAEQVRRLQEDLARERSEIADCAAAMESLKARLTAIEQKA